MTQGSSVARAPVLVFLTSAVVLGSELLVHRQLSYVGDYFEATRIISIAIMGMALGAMGAHYAHKRFGNTAALLAAVGLGLSVTLCFATFPFVGENLTDAIVVMLLPFVLGGFLIANCFARGASGVIYFFDLAGACAGILLVAIVLPLVREEGAQALMCAVAWAIPFAAFTPAAGIMAKVWRYGTLLVGLGFIVFAVVNLVTDTYNIALDTRSTGHRRNKVFNLSLKNHPDAAVYSRSSLAGRTDIFLFPPYFGAYAYNYQNGSQIDILRPGSAKYYIWDPRVPRGVLPESPVVFVIGTAGEGILKTLRTLGAKVFGAEINPATYHLLVGPHSDLCDDCYRGVSVTLGDGRTALAASTQRFDMITALNAHMDKVSQSPASAEFIYTKEAIALYLRRLTDQGVLNFEERFFDKTQKRPPSSPKTVRLVATVLAALREVGATEPRQHVVVFRWKSGGHYDQVLVRRTPWDADGLARVRAWLAQVSKARAAVNAPFSSTIDVTWMPDERRDGDPVADLLSHGQIPSGRPAMLVEPITDDRPYPFQRRDREPVIIEAFADLLKMAVILIIVPLILIFVRGSEVGRRPLIRPLVAASLLGVGYLLVEINLIQQLQLLVGSVTLTLVVVLGGMLFFSGVGGLLSARIRDQQILSILLFLVPLVLAVQAWLIPFFFDVAVGWPLAVRCLVALSAIFLPAFLMGIPLPTLLEDTKHIFGDEYAALIFGVNGGAAAFGTVLSFMLSMQFGLAISYQFACVIYLLCAVLLAWPMRGRVGISRIVA